MARKKKKIPYIGRDAAPTFSPQFRAEEDLSVFAALANAAAPIEPEAEAGEPEAALNEVEEIPLPDLEQVIIHAQNGNRLYWNAVQNRWLIVGIPEEEQISPPPRLQVHAQWDDNRFVFHEHLGHPDDGAPAPAAAPPLNFFNELIGDRPISQRQAREAELDQTDKKSKIKFKSKRNTEPMHFEDLSNEGKIDVMKREFITVLKSVFDNPESLKSFITNKKLSREQAKLIFKNLHKFNKNKCPCCRQFDQKLLTTPIDTELEPLIDIAQSSAKSRTY